MNGSKLYSSMAGWFPLLTPVEDYRLEASIYRDLLLEHSPDTKTVLELGSGGGHNAFHLKRHFQVTLTDISPEMLSQSEKLNPECEHLLGDMRSLRLNRFFDAVFIHDAVSLMTTQEDLEKAISTAYAHCKPGGSALFVPDYTRESFSPATDHGGTDDGDRGMRYLEWTYDPDPTDSTYVVEFAFLLKDETGKVRCEHDRHTLGLFSEAEWLSAVSKAGFHASIRRVSYEQDGFLGLTCICARKMP